MKKHTTSSRKRDHVNLTVNRNVTFRQKTAGFEQWELIHNALPEINFSDVETRTELFGKAISFPFLISCMTGGYKEAEKINRELAEVCEEKKIAMGVGSQRQAMEDTTYHSSFTAARKAAPSIPLIGNIGAPEVATLKDSSPVQKLAELIHADAFAVHLNPLQEFLQPEGNTNFRGVLKGIELLVKHLSIPIVVKEIGAGISGKVALQLINAGVTYIDVAGAGGTSWAGVEILRSTDQLVKRKKKKDVQKSVEETENPFWDWGIPTAQALSEVAELKKNFPTLKIISSGGIVNGVDCAKSVAMGADLCASARPMLKALISGGKKSLHETIDRLILEFKGAMFLTGCATIVELQRRSPLHKISL